MTTFFAYAHSQRRLLLQRWRNRKAARIWAIEIGHANLAKRLGKSMYGGLPLKAAVP